MNPWTTGPWEVDRRTWNIGSGSTGDPVCSTARSHRFEEDARLIALAPDLWEALNWLVESRPHPTAECWAQAEAVVKKALGS